jgi:hypothetical protein
MAWASVGGGGGGAWEADPHPASASARIAGMTMVAMKRVTRAYLPAVLA